MLFFFSTFLEEISETNQIFLWKNEQKNKKIKKYISNRIRFFFPRFVFMILFSIFIHGCSYRNYYIYRKIFLSGHSAGAHLCAMVFASSWFGTLPNDVKSLFNGVFYLAGIYDLRPLLTTTINEPLGLDNQSATENSPMFLVDKMSENFPKKDNKISFKAHIIVAENDSPAFNAQGNDFCKKVCMFF